MPGGFHPFHAGHADLYQQAKKAFPGADIYVAATNDQSERPFPFALKEKLAKLAGVESGHFVQVKSPFQAKEITQNYNPEEDVLIFVRSEKDRNEPPKPGGTKKDGSPAYFQPYTGKDMQPFSQHAYIDYLKTVEFGPGITSATQIRNAWPTLNDKRKTALVMSLYPAAQKNLKLAKNVVDMFDQVMGGQVDEGWKDVVAGGAMALGALGAGAQTMPDINVQQVELANKYYNVLVQRAKEDGIKLDTRTLNVIKAKAQDAAAKKTQQSTQQQGFPSQGSERKVAKDAGQFESQGVAEGASLSVEQLAHISDKALDDAYHYGRSTPGANFGWMANMQSAKAAKRLIDAGETDIETISDAIHKGWNVTAAADYKGQLQLDTPTPDEKKLKRAKLAMQSYSQLPEEEKEKDRVVARALLTALRGKIDETQGLPYPSTYGQETEPLKSHGARRIVAMTNEDSNMSKSLDYLEEK
jgi:hypothetical protein